MASSAAPSPPSAPGLIASGTRKAAGLTLVPRETARALREDVAWLKNQLTLPTS